MKKLRISLVVIFLFVNLAHGQETDQMSVRKIMDRVAQLSGGWADFLEQPDQSADIYARILSDINGRYIIGYQPANTERDGKLRQVTIEVRGHPEYSVWGRTSYYAPVP